MDFITQNKEEFNKIIEHLKHEISNLRTGRATPALVEDVVVEAYGVRQPLKAVASISVADAKTLNIDPWDKSLTQAIESGLRASNLGINPVNDGKLIRLPLPDLTQERRQELIKVLHQKLEQARVSVRNIREEIRKDIDKKEKDKEIAEDDKFRMQDELEKLVKEYNDKLKVIGEDKEREITTV
ncbi:MAG: ribosome recycling factor [Candidatus Magasanikbacteria bacterium]